MPKKKYIVDLTKSERAELEQLTKKGKIAAYKMSHARILLLADVNQPEGGWTDLKISEALNVSQATIERVRQRFVESGIESALTRREQKNRRSKIIVSVQRVTQPKGLTPRFCQSYPKRSNYFLQS